jgi:Txe/YoeB family toxin of Txe-Axe toxin-antitoxin module
MDYNSIADSAAGHRDQISDTVVYRNPGALNFSVGEDTILNDLLLFDAKNGDDLYYQGDANASWAKKLKYVSNKDIEKYVEYINSLPNDGFSGIRTFEEIKSVFDEAIAFSKAIAAAARRDAIDMDYNSIAGSAAGHRDQINDAVVYRNPGALDNEINGPTNLSWGEKIILNDLLLFDAENGDDLYYQGDANASWAEKLKYVSNKDIEKYVEYINSLPNDGFSGIRTFEEIKSVFDEAIALSE